MREPLGRRDSRVSHPRQLIPMETSWRVLLSVRMYDYYRFHAYANAKPARVLKSEPYALAVRRASRIYSISIMDWVIGSAEESR